MYCRFKPCRREPSARLATRVGRSATLFQFSGRFKAGAPKALPPAERGLAALLALQPMPSGLASNLIVRTVYSTVLNWTHNPDTAI